MALSLAVGGAPGMASVRRHQEPLPCLTLTCWPKLSPISSAGATSVITYLRKGKNTVQCL